MDKFLSKSPENPAKRIKRENCPHNERCYGKNPHHFKQFEHPHLVKFIETGENIPDGMPQPKNVYIEQIEIIKDISKTQNNVLPKNEKNSEKNKNESDSSKVASTSSTSLVFKINSEDITPTPQSGSTLDKLQKNGPYNLFFTTIPESPSTAQEKNAITFTDLLCPSLGILKESLQINFLIDIDWLLQQYKARNVAQKPLTILYGDDRPDMVEFMDRYCPTVKYHFVKMKDAFGCHHSKIGIYAYEDNSIRIVVSTANLYMKDWNCYNQGLWISPCCPQLPENSSTKDGESPTFFKSNLLSYLQSYKLPILNPWIKYVEKSDFSHIKVFFIASIPGKHPPTSSGCHLHKVASLLSNFVELPEKMNPEDEGPLSWGVLAQASSIGSMGKSPAEWLRGAVLRTLASHKKGPVPTTSNVTLNLVYPSVENVMTGYFGAQSGGCLPYSKQTNEKQRWLQEYMHQWKADELNRTRAMPHIKSYCRVSPCLTKLAYFLLTSANLSKSAWGGNIQKDKQVYVRSYEAGVLFLPKFFDEQYFEIKKTLSSKNKETFPFMYDLPLTPYKKDDYPWCN